MKKLSISRVLGVLLLFFSIPAQPALSASTATDCEDLRGRWKTNLGAIVNFDKVDTKTGGLTGSYQPASLLERHFPLAGFVNPNPGGKVADGEDQAVTLSFSVSFQEFGGITNWTGICRVVDGAVRLETQDLVARPIAEGPWAHVIASHDTLVPLEDAPLATGEEEPPRSGEETPGGGDR